MSFQTNSDPVVRLTGVGKHFSNRLPRGQRSLVRDVVLLHGLRRRSHLWPVRNIDLDIAAGDVLGLIGRNGSGKTTLLSLIAGASSPSEGEIAVRGRVVALLALGTGFHPDMTAREAIGINGAVLGLAQREALAATPAILDFAELAAVADQPIRTYSSGMAARLGFAIAVHARPDVLLVDEVLAVGDEAFQQKCTARLDAMHAAGMTTVFVSHNLPLVERLCRRVVWLDGGAIVADGAPAEVIPRYLAAVEAGAA